MGVERINGALMLQVADWVAEWEDAGQWHTLTVTLNGQHGGADIELVGTDDDGDVVTCLGVK